LNWQGSKPCSKRIGAGLPAPVRFVFLQGNPAYMPQSKLFSRVGTFFAPANYRLGHKRVRACWSSAVFK
jgi:hypothetical protein